MSFHGCFSVTEKRNGAEVRGTHIRFAGCINPPAYVKPYNIASRLFSRLLSIYPQMFRLLNTVGNVIIRALR